jgi:hypothetical protein
MNKKILAIAILTIIAVTTPVFAQDIPTGAIVPPGAGTRPVIKAKWETPDNYPKLGTQIDPPKTLNGKITVEYWVVVTDFNGKGDVDRAYVDVWHPDGTFKYQIPLTEYDTSTPQKRADAAALVQAAYNAGILVINTNPGEPYVPFTLVEVKDELIENSAKLYHGTADLDYHQMCGSCKGPCDVPGTDKDYPYKVDAYAFDRGNVPSDYFTNYFEYICWAGIDMDFGSIDFGEVMVSSHKWIEGDSIFNPGTSNIACEFGTSCVPPTVRNIGNTPVYIDVTFDDMGFGFSGPPENKDWNVEYDASIKHDGEVTFKPFVTKRLPNGGVEPEPYCEENYGIVDLCDTEKISFSIHVKKSIPGKIDPYSGTATVEPVAMGFPWWTKCG